jgi:hypothetical protein
MKRTPTIEELHAGERFESLATVSHARIKDFVLSQVMEDRRFVPYYMIYQTVLFLAAIFFFTRSVVLSVRGDSAFLLISIGAIVFSLTLLVLIHELLHGLVLKLAGAPKVTFGMVPGRFIFYAEADRFVLSQRPFLWVAFTPLVAVQIVTLVLIIVWQGQPMVYFPLMVMCIHSFFCAGDVALVTLFYRFPGLKVYTYDNREEKTSYYFVEKTPAN